MSASLRRMRSDGLPAGWRGGMMRRGDWKAENVEEEAKNKLTTKPGTPSTTMTKLEKRI